MAPVFNNLPGKRESFGDDETKAHKKIDAQIAPYIDVNQPARKRKMHDDDQNAEVIVAEEKI